MKNELWNAVAAGLLTYWEATLKAITSQADREIQETRRVWPGWLTVQSYTALGFTISQSALGLLMDEIPERISAPGIRDQIAAGRPTFVSNPVVVDSTLSADDPGADVTTIVYQWNAGTRHWTRLGSLADYAQPGAGTYVLVNESQSEVLGLPSQFLTIT